MCIFADRYFLFFSLQFFNVYFCSSLCAYSLTGYEPKIISTSNLFSAKSSLEVLVEDHLRSSLEAEKPRKLFPCFVFVTRSRKTHKARTRVRQSLEAETFKASFYWKTDNLLSGFEFVTRSRKTRIPVIPWTSLDRAPPRGKIKVSLFMAPTKRGKPISNRRMCRQRNLTERIWPANHAILEVGRRHLSFRW